MVIIMTILMKMNTMGMMRYLVETDYLSGSRMRIKKESFTSVAAAAGTLTHLCGELSGGSRTRRCGSALSSQVHTHISWTHLRLNMLAYSPESSDISCKQSNWLHCLILNSQYLVFQEKNLKNYTVENVLS